MKKLLFIIVMLTGLFGMSQAPEGMVKIDQDQTELQAYATHIADLASNHPEYRTVPAPLLYSQKEIETNDPVLANHLNEFYDSARYYQVDFREEFNNLESIQFVKRDFNFLGLVSEDGKTIYLNAELKPYKYLTRVIFLRQFGNLYNLRASKGNRHDIMGEHWEIDQRHEEIAKFLYDRPHQKKQFFERLAERHSLSKRI